LPELRTGVAIADAAELVLDEGALEDEELELVWALDELRLEDDSVDRVDVDVVDPALLVLAKEEESDEDEPAGVRLLDEIMDDKLARDEEAATGLLRDREAVIELLRDEVAADDELAELLERTGGIGLLALLILLDDPFTGSLNIRTCLRRQNWSRKRY
jgi:hypothetical protein